MRVAALTEQLMD
jgi:hypothetical protein